MVDRAYLGSAAYVDRGVATAKQWADAPGNAFFVAMAEAQTDGIAVWSADDRLLYANATYRSMFPAPPNTMRVGVAFADAIRIYAEHEHGNWMPADRESWIARRIAQHRNPIAPFEARRGEAWFRFNETRLPTGEVLAIISNVTAIEVRQGGKAKDALEKLSDLLESKVQLDLMSQVIENLEQGVAVYDAETRLVLWNPRFVEFLGLPERLVGAGRPAIDIMRHMAGQGVYGDGGIDEIVARRMAFVFGGNVTRQDLSLHGRTIDVIGGPIPGGGFVFTFTDLSERHKAEADLADAKSRAEVANLAKSEFLASMSHELRTPLNSIIGFSQIIESAVHGPLGSDKYGEYLGYIQTSAHHLLALINDVLDVSAIEAGKLVLSEEWVALGDIADAAAALISPSAGKAGVRLDHDLTGSAVILNGDGRRLTQVLVNLLSNAVKFTPTGGTVTLWAERAGDGGIAVHVDDTGIGMTPDELVHAMEPFGRADTPLNRKLQGTGLGLPLSRTLIEAHGGHLDLNSAPGQGTRVTVSFPARMVVADGDQRQP